MDRVYIPRFDVPERPKLLELPAGQAKILKRDVTRLFSWIHRTRERSSDEQRGNALKKLIENKIGKIKVCTIAFMY